MKTLFATDGSPYSEAAGEFLKQLPLPTGTAVHVVSVAPEWIGAAGLTMEGMTVSDLQARLFDEDRRRAAAVLERAEAMLAREGLTITAALRRGGPAPEILAAAEEMGADLIVVGSEGLTGVPGFLLGSVARNVAHHAERPVLVARAPRNNLRQVIIAIDASDHAVRAVDFAQTLPLPPESEFLVTHIVSRREVRGEQAGEETDLAAAVAGLKRQRHNEAGVLLGAAMSRLEAAGKRTVMAIREGSPAAAILELAEERPADLIIAGARGVSGFRSLVLGSVADRLLKFAHCSVLIVP